MFKKGDKVRTVNEKFSEEDFGGIKKDSIYIVERIETCPLVDSECLRIYKCNHRVKLLNIQSYECFGSTEINKYLLIKIDKFEEHKQRMLNV